MMTRDEFIAFSLSQGMPAREAKKVSSYTRYVKYSETGVLPPTRGKPAARKIKTQSQLEVEHLQGVQFCDERSQAEVEEEAREDIETLKKYGPL